MAINPLLGGGSVNPTSLDLDAEVKRLAIAGNTADAEARGLIEKLNKMYTDKDGKPVTFNNLAEWKNALETANSGKGMFRGDYEFKKGHTEFQQMLEKVKPAITNLENAMSAISSLRSSMASSDAMNKLLDSGDIAGAVMLLQTTRASGLDAQLKTQITGMQNRNIQIQSLTSQLATEQGKNPRDDAKITEINGKIQKLNGDSQLQMIEIQDLVNKRNQAYDMLSNLLNKFQKTLDGIVSNMR